MAPNKRKSNSERCAICGCHLNWGNHRNQYASPTPEGRAHGTRHHYVPERFFGRSANRRGTQRDRIFETCPWNGEGQVAHFCYECHEEMLHNPVLLPEDIERLSALVRRRALGEEGKPEGRDKIAGRIRLLQEVIRRGLKEVAEDAD